MDQHPETQSPPKQPWQTPMIEELDFSETSAAFINPGTADAGIYSH